VGAALGAVGGLLKLDGAGGAIGVAGERIGEAALGIGGSGTDAGETLGDEAGETLGDEAGETLGDEAGETLGDEAGETLGDEAGKGGEMGEDEDFIGVDAIVGTDGVMGDATGAAEGMLGVPARTMVKVT
jgi:hypothetical protein